MITLSATHQQTKRVVDPVNSIYQTVLTIDPSVSWSSIVGTYNCTVLNARGQSSKTVVLPGEICTSYCSGIYHLCIYMRVDAYLHHVVDISK